MNTLPKVQIGQIYKYNGYGSDWYTVEIMYQPNSSSFRMRVVDPGTIQILSGYDFNCTITTLNTYFVLVSTSAIQ